MSENNPSEAVDPLLCKPEKGLCETPFSSAEEIEDSGQEVKQKNVRVIYFTDPICSACWGIEPQLRKLKLEYGNALKIEYHMGGLLPSWDIYNAGGISKPSDVAHHWDEVSRYYQMPIDGSVWITDPLSSSYPPSIAFKAAEFQNKDKAQVFLRILREMVFLEKQNITKWEVMTLAADKSGLDAAQLKIDMEGRAKAEFEQDLQLARQMGVRGFPTLILVNENGQGERISGFKPYQVFENTVLKLDEGAIKFNYPKESVKLFELFPTLTTREFAELKEVSFSDAEKELSKMVKEGVLKELKIKNGSLFKLIIS